MSYVSEGPRIPEDLSPARADKLVARAVYLARATGASAGEELLARRFGGGGPCDLRKFHATQTAGIRAVVRPDPVQVIAVTGGKGGVGKTSVAVNLAAALAATGKRVLLFDGDMGLANRRCAAGRHSAPHA